MRYDNEFVTTGWGISRLTPLYPTNAPGSQYIVVGGKAVRNAWHGCQVRTTSCSWDKGVLTDLCLKGVLTDLCLTLYNVQSVEQKSIGLKFSKSRTGSDVRYSCHHNSSLLLSPYLRIRGVSLSSVHYNQSHCVYINRTQQYICLIWH